MKFTGHNVRVSPKASLGNNVRIGDNTVIYDNVTVGDNTIVANDCVLGEPTTSYYSDDKYENPPTIIGSDGLIRSHTIIYSGVSIGSHLETGHRATIREKTSIGNNCKIGTLCDLQGHLTIGDYCRLHSNVHLCQHSMLGNYVFIYPYVVLANDKHPPSNHLVGPEIGDYTQIGVHSVLISNVKIGSHCLIGANSTVAKSYADHSFILGSPAKRISDVRELKSEDGDQLYPWDERFSTGLPWAP